MAAKVGWIGSADSSRAPLAARLEVSSILDRESGIRYVQRMRFAEADDSGGYLISGYGPEGIRIGARRYVRGILLMPNRILEDWGPDSPDALDSSHFQPLLELAPETVLLGTGRTQSFPPPAAYAILLERRIGLEAMDTGAACRTYNILMSEGRRVAAALMPW